MNNNYCVYCHISPSHKRYVGISNNPKKRWNNGKGYKKNYLFARAIEKYGWDNFQHIILYSNLTIEEAKCKEIQLISLWKLTNPQYGYNLRDGGDGSFSEHSRKLMSLSRMGNQNTKGYHPSEATKEKISQSLKQYYATHPNPNTGKKMSEEQRLKLKNRVVSEETKEKMRQHHADVSGEKNPSAKSIQQFDLMDNFIEEFPYAKLAALKYNIDLSSIIKCCKGKKKTCGGYKWRYTPT